MNVPANTLPDGLAAFTGLMSVLFTNCGTYKDERSERLQLYWSILGKYPIGEIMAAISDWVQNSNQMPPIHDLLKRIPSYLTDDFVAAESWRRIVQAAQIETRSAYHPEFGSTPELSSVTKAERDLLSVVGGIERLMLSLNDAIQAEHMRRGYTSAYLNSSQKIEIRAEIERVHAAARLDVPAVDVSKRIAAPVKKEVPQDLQIRCPNCKSALVRTAFINDNELDCSCKRCSKKFTFSISGC